MQFGSIYLHAFIYLFISSGVFTRHPQQRWSLKQGIIRVLGQCGAKNGCVVFASLQQPQGATSPTDSSVPVSAAHLEEKKTKVYVAIKEENLIRTIMFRVGSANIANVLMGGRGIANSGFLEAESVVEFQIFPQQPSRSTDMSLGSWLLLR